MVDNDEEGERLTRREENRELIAKHRATVEPRGCPTPGSCSAVAELADLKQRLLPQYKGRAERAEHEKDVLLKKLIVHQTAIANLHDVIDGMRGAARSATAAIGERAELIMRLRAALGACEDKGWRLHVHTIKNAIKSLSVEVGAMAMLRELREYLSDGRHSQWRYVESGEQGEDMGEWVKKLGSFLDSRDMKGEQP